MNESRLNECIYHTQQWAIVKMNDLAFSSKYAAGWHVNLKVLQPKHQMTFGMQKRQQKSQCVTQPYPAYGT